ncbi:MAG TPA: M20/M25/M40 family metallo-hydrolase, partial [Planctomycetota bacterium]|nr:M20/M25/M40 family metallo-hydrolase [Planctomycetota bacterium]
MRIPRAALRLPLLVAALVGVTAPRSARAEDDDPLQGLAGSRALEWAKELSADEMKGRKTGFKGGEIVESWLQAKLAAMGLDPMDRDGTYLHRFTFGATQVVAPIALSLGDRKAEYGKDFVDLVYTGAGKVEAEVVFVGYGITAKDRGWDDYDGVDVTGKIVLAIRGAPAARESEFPEERQIGWKSALAADRGAAGFLLAEGRTATPGTIQERFHRAGMPALWITSEYADGILAKAGRTLEDLKAQRDRGEPGRSFGTGTTVRVEVNGQFLPQAIGNTALAGWFGRDPDLRGEAIIVGAHADHLGEDATGRIYNGADDNASGSGVLLALAETLKKNRWKPKRTVVFAWFGGEEQGLVGSRHLATDLPFNHQSVIAMLNIDMAGIGGGDVNLGGGEGYPDLYARAVGALPEAWRTRVRPFRVEPNSDHWPFFERGVPALFANSAGERRNYHMVSDDTELLQTPALEGVAQVVGRALVALADHPEPLATGREAAGFVLREGSRVVVAGAGDLPTRADCVKEGWSCVATMVDEAEGGAIVAWARAASAVREHPRDYVLVKGAGDLVNAARAGRTALLPCLRCPASAKAFPGVLPLLRDSGVRWVAPFDAAVPLTAAERDAILAAAAEAGAERLQRGRLGRGVALERRAAAVRRDEACAPRNRRLEALGREV